MNRIKQLDGLRLFMTTIIIFCHFEFLNNGTFIGNLYWTYIHNPILAVDYFFLLSGFGLYFKYQNTKFNTNIKNCLDFAFNKIKKIYPIYLISILLSSIYYINFEQLKSSLYVLFRYLLDLALVLTLSQSLTGMTKFSHAFNAVGWFLSTLFICYILSPISIKIVNKSKNIHFLLLVNFIQIILLNLLFSKIESFNFTFLNYTLNFNDLAYTSPFIRILYLQIGMILCRLFLNNKKHFNTFIEVLVVIYVTLYYFLRNTISLYIPSILLTTIDILSLTILIYVFSQGYGFFSKQLSSDTIQNLSKYTTYFYLFHYPIRMIIHKLFKLYDLTNIYYCILQIILILIFTYFISIFFYKLINRKKLS